MAFAQRPHVAAFLMELESNHNFRSNPGSPVSQSLIQDLGGRIRAIYLLSLFLHNINDLLEMAVLVSSADAR